MESPGAGVTVSADLASQAWMARLRCSSAERDVAAAELHGLLLRAARFEIARRRAAFPDLGGADLEDLAWQSANDALMSILRRLGDFRGESQFTTWACKFAIVEAGVKVRRHAWRGREVPVAPASWPIVADAAPGPQLAAEADDARALAERLLGPEGPEFSCEECFEVLDVYVERELADDAEAGTAMPAMRAHLAGCSACRDDHDSLLALLRNGSGT